MEPATDPPNTDAGALGVRAVHRSMAAMIGFVASSATAIASIAATTQSMTYSDGASCRICVAEIRKVMVSKSNEARGSSWSDTGKVDRRNSAGEELRTEAEDCGLVTRITGGAEVVLSGERSPSEETVM